MTTVTEALGHFGTLVTAEVARELERTAIAANRVLSDANEANAFGGSRMYLVIGQHFAEHLVTLREYITATAAAHLKPRTAQADSETLAKLRRGAMQAFDDAIDQFRTALRRFTNPPGGAAFGTHESGRGGEAVLDKAAARERMTLGAQLALALSHPSRGSGPTGHRLAAILSTDVVGFTTLMAADEKATLEAVSPCISLIRETVERNGGRVVKTMGDGTLNEFGSAVDAMKAALEVQRSMAQRNVDKPEAERIVLRMGIAVGDVVPDGEDIMGDTVNLAARLQAAATPGTIATLEHVRDDLTNKLELASEDLGQLELKGIGRRVRVVQITAK